MYKITVSKGDIRKHAKSMLNVSGMFFITRGVSSLMNGKRREIPVTPPECELQWRYYSPSIFPASSQTAPTP